MEGTNKQDIIAVLQGGVHSAGLQEFPILVVDEGQDARLDVPVGARGAEQGQRLGRRDPAR